MTPIITLQRLGKSYGDKKVLQDISLDIFPGQIIGYIGPNGAGKSTTVKILTGIIQDYEGEVLVKGVPLREQVAAITKRSMNGELDFATALRERVGMLQGLKLDALEQTWAATRLMPGAPELVATMRAHGAYTALVSGGFTWFTGRVAALCGFDTHRANVLLDDGLALTGEVGEPILDRDAKLATLRELSAQHGVPLQDCLAVGDGANDPAMVGAAGLGVAFHAKPLVAAAAQVRVEHCGLRALLFMQGYPASAFSG